MIFEAVYDYCGADFDWLERRIVDLVHSDEYYISTRQHAINCGREIFGTGLDLDDAYDFTYADAKKIEKISWLSCAGNYDEIQIDRSARSIRYYCNRKRHAGCQILISAVKENKPLRVLQYITHCPSACPFEKYPKIEIPTTSQAEIIAIDTDKGLVYIEMGGYRFCAAGLPPRDRGGIQIPKKIESDFVCQDQEWANFNIDPDEIRNFIFGRGENQETRYMCDLEKIGKRKFRVVEKTENGWQKYFAILADAALYRAAQVQPENFLIEEKHQAQWIEITDL